MVTINIIGFIALLITVAILFGFAGMIFMAYLARKKIEATEAAWMEICDSVKFKPDPSKVDINLLDEELRKGA